MTTPPQDPAGANRAAAPEPPAPHGWVRVDKDDPTRLWMVGEVDLSAVERAGAALWDALPSIRTVEAGQMTFMDSSGLRCLIAALTGARSADEQVTVRQPSQQVMDVLRTTRLDALLRLVPRDHDHDGT